MSTERKKKRNTPTRKQKQAEAQAREHASKERELRTSIITSAVIYIALWVVILTIVWGNGWLGPGE